MKKILLFSLALIVCLAKIQAQKAWATPDPINPNDSITIWVDLKKCDRQQLAGTTDPLYMWTWAPNEHAVGHPLHNGTWLASNDALQMRSAGNDLYFFRMVPTSFYEVTAAVALMEKGDKPSTAEEVRMRALKALAEEARMMLDEGVVSTAAEIDICMLLGAGWPMMLGGILPYLDREGISEAVSGQRFHPAGVASLA